ncbi:type I polyketide synthase [Rhizobacter sp. OV335]|uniref:type I polyketide synthase n=1 Tax=Rhizobacter sp. OV335 TaxID=1500264 RepID=UPI000916254E|nr:type I polyketide synthase [Rhizobacter sp. OV335]SHN35306.1 epothilone polyketide synthase C [Rhizobacter sp. OV335]
MNGTDHDTPAHAAAAVVAGVAVVGIGCRFPGGVSDPASFWHLLSEGRDAITEIPASRIDLGHYHDPRPATPGRIMTRWGGFLDGIEDFDAEFFGISPREAERLDPQQRLLLETAWEALEDAGQDVSRIDADRAGVYVGQWLSDFEARLFSDPEAVDFYMTTGSGRYASSGRLSYALGLRGPSLTLDTACSSSLAAIHLAARAVRHGECTLAIAGGVNIILQPHISIAYSQSRMMAPDGRCKFGDARGDGYVRSEGAGLVVLKTLAQAQADGDRIYALIRGSAVNNDGRSSGSMGTPSRSGQQALLRSAYRDAGRAAAEVGYVEAHGTGTRAGDPVELGALSDVLGEGRAAGACAAVGSVKTNFGHTEGAAGVAGFIKAALALQHRQIPVSLHCREPNPAIPWAQMPVEVAREARPWPADAPLAGVSAFGIAGTNAHVVLEGAPQVETGSAEHTVPLLVLSARSDAALRALALRYAALLTDGAPLADVCWNAATRRTALERRAAFVADDALAMAAAVKRYADGEAAAAEGVAPSERPKLAFVCPGQGAQWTGMARELMAREHVFRAALDACDDAARPFAAEWSITEQLAAEPGSAAYRLDQIDVIQPVLVALAWAYAALWRSHGVEPDAVVGHSMGEVAAAAVAGALSLPQAMRIICRRSALMRRTSGQGAMALVELSMADAQARIAGHEAQVAVAVSNSPRSSVISGDPAVVQALMAQLESEGVFCRLVKVDVASHSPQMAPLAAELAAELHDLQPQATRAALYSTVLARRAEGAELTGRYWADNLRQPVRFGATVQQLLADGITVFVELGPHPVLLPSVQQTAQAGGREVTTIACARRDEAELPAMRAALGALHCAGVPLDWSRMLPRGRTLTLPTYPWQRERHWIAAADIAPAGVQGHGPVVDSRHPVLGAGIQLAGMPAGALWNVSIDPGRVPAWFAHALHGSAVLPASAWLELSLAAVQALAPGAGVQGLRFDRALHLQPDAASALQLQAVAGADGALALNFQTRGDSAWMLHAQAQVAPVAASVHDTTAQARMRTQPAVSGADLYARLDAAGAKFGTALHGIAQAWFAPAEALAQLTPMADERFGIPPAALDACFQLMVTLAPPGALWLPTRLDGARRLRAMSGPGWIHARATAPQGDGEPVRVDALLFDEQGPVLQLDGLVLERLGAAARADAADAFYALGEVETTLTPKPQARDWAVIGDRGGLAQALQQRGETVHRFADAAALATLALSQRLDVVDLRPLDLQAVGDVSALHAIVQDAQAVIRLRAGADVRLWLVTAGSLAQAPLSGLAATLAAEHGDRFGGLIELDGALESLIDAVQADAGSCTLRGGCWTRPVLRRLAPQPTLALPWRADASCLLTGGLGGVGRHVAGWLVAQGVRHLVVLGRTPLPPREQWGASQAPAVQAVRELEAHGASVDYAAVDVADEAALSAFLARHRAEGRPPIHSAIHAAGITDDTLMHELDAASLAAVLAPKLQGAWNLHRALPELDRMVFFSSMAALMPQAGQASYAAANAFLDALARQRRAQGRHAQSIGWGVWSQTGVMRGEGGRRQLDELQRQGIGGFAPSQALALLGDALRQDVAHLLVMPVDWRAMRKSLGARDVALLNELLADATVPVADAPLAESSDPAERRRALDRAVRDVVGRVLKLTPSKIDARKPLGTMGLTSLMALELRNRLEPLHGKPLSATLAWNYPTVDALVAFLSGDHEPAVVAAEPEAPTPELAAVAELSDEDAARLLRKRR